MTTDTEELDEEELQMQRRMRIAGLAMVLFALFLVAISSYTPKVDQVNKIPLAPPPHTSAESGDTTPAPAP